MKRILSALFALQSLALAEFQQPVPGVHLWQDTCNVYVLKYEDAALVINLGDGSVLEHLTEIGVKRVEWVLLTDHHRELCQGAPSLDRAVTQVATSEIEKEIPSIGEDTPSTPSARQKKTHVPIMHEVVEHPPLILNS